MLPDYDNMTNSELCLAASNLAQALDHLLGEEEAKQRPFAEIKKIYDDTYRPSAVAIAYAAGSINRQWKIRQDVTPIFADLQPRYLRSFIATLRGICQAYNKSQEATA